MNTKSPAAASNRRDRQPDDDLKLMRLSAVLAATTLSRSSFLAGVKAGLYPRPIKIGLRSVAWRRSDIAELVRNGLQIRGSSHV